MLDWSHIMNSPQHADTAIQGLKDAGLRSVFAQGGPIGPFAEWWTPKSTNRHPDDIRRVKKQYFSSNDQLITLAMAINGPEFSSLETTIDDIKLARDVLAFQACRWAASPSSMKPRCWAPISPMCIHCALPTTN